MDWAYAPNDLAVSVGTPVTWINAGAQPHAVTADDGASFDSGNLDNQARVDGGGTWREAAITQPLGASTCVQWALAWDERSPGAHEILARAIDCTGAADGR